MNNYEGKRLFSSWYIPDFNKPIGTGSFGVVYEMRSYVVSNAFSAVKIISIPRNRAEYDAKVAEMGATEEAVQENFRETKDALVSEIEMMLKVNGFTNCVGCMSYALEEHEDCFGWDILIQMEKLETLDSYFRSQGEIYDTDIIQLGIDMCSALEACELNNIVHRDVKPANIMVKSIKGRPIYKLGDFGVARVLSNSGTMTMSGTFDYMAPELLCGEGDLRVDIYSLGLVLYELLNANRMPFLPDYPNKVTGKDRDMARKKRLTGEPMPDPLYAIGTDLAKVIRKACAHDREERYSSPKEMRLALEKVLEGHTKRAVFTAPAVGAYQPSERKVVVRIAGNCETVPYDGKEHKVEGFTANGESHNVSMGLAPGAAAIARGTQAGRYMMGLTRDSFLVNSQDERQTVETVLVQDGELVIEAAPHQEKEPAVQIGVPEQKPEGIKPEKKEKGVRLPNSLLISSRNVLKKIGITMGTFFLVLVVLEVVFDRTANEGEKKSVTPSQNSASVLDDFPARTASDNSTNHYIDAPSPTSPQIDSYSQGSSSNSYSGNASTSTSFSIPSPGFEKGGGSPSDSDLTAEGVTANIRYPKDKYYLDEYKYGYINAPKGDSVLGFKYSRPSDGTSVVCYPQNGESVTILALQYGRACVILDESKIACWVNEDYIRIP